MGLGFVGAGCDWLTSRGGLALVARTLLTFDSCGSKDRERKCSNRTLVTLLFCKCKMFCSDGLDESHGAADCSYDLDLKCLEAPKWPMGNAERGFTALLPELLFFT